MRIFLLCFLLSASVSKAESSLVSIENLIFAGKFTKAKLDIEKKIKVSNSSDKAKLYQLKGEILSLEGDIDEAYLNWQHSNKIRRKIYRKNECQLAWNYALLSNYYYQKIEPKLAVLYADSCSQMIEGLTLQQKKEIKIYRIWNLLAQSYKLGLGGPNVKTRLSHYEDIRTYYLKSLAFIRAEKIHPYWEAKTLHLIANSYLDNVFDVLNEENNYAQLNELKKIAEEYYRQADKIWLREYGAIHYERAKTLYVYGLLYSILPLDKFPESLGNAIQLFEKSERAFGLVDKSGFASIPNKQDALQCCWLHKAALYKKIEDAKDPLIIAKLEEINQRSIDLWKILYHSFKTKNLNQSLSIYGLVPFQDVIAIENLKRIYGRNYSLQKMFEANQLLKYYDLNRFAHATSRKQTVSIAEVQRSLKDDACFIDFIDEQQFFFISKTKCQLVNIPSGINVKLDTLRRSILNNDFEQFCRLSREIYTGLFSTVSLKKYRVLRISPAQKYNTLPFEALLESERGIASKSYSKLDFIVRNKEITYCLSARSLLDKTKSIKLSGTALSPRSRQRSKLPFSEQLTARLKERYSFASSHPLRTTLQDLLNAKGEILHFSGHGLIDADNPSLSRLDLGKNFVTLEDVYLLKNSSSVVVLNACNSLNGKTNLGDGVNGFARAFLAIGADATLSNLWEVDDMASNVLFEKFYTALTKGGSASASLRDVQLQFLAGEKGFDAPYYWAGHRLYGEFVVKKQEVNSGLKWSWILSITLIFLSIMVVWRGVA